MRKNRLPSLMIVLALIFSMVLPMSGVVYAADLIGEGTAVSPYLIRNLDDFYKIQNNLSAHYLIVNDLDFDGAKRNPMAEFKGVLDGGNHTIKNLYIVSEVNYYGIFKKLNGAKIQNITVENLNVYKAYTIDYVGIFAGYSANTVFYNCNIINPQVGGKYYVGAFVGSSNNDTFNYCAAKNGYINAHYNVGGLVGNIIGGKFYRCYSTTNITGYSQYVGGLIGLSYSTVRINECFAMNTVRGHGHVGGMVGGTYNASISIDNSYTRSAISNTYTSNSTYDSVGGFVGYGSQAKITNSYSASTLEGTTKYGLTQGTATNSYFDSTIAKITTPTSQARTTAEFKKTATYENWNFHTIWHLEAGMDYPQLRFTYDPKIISVSNLYLQPNYKNLKVNETLQLTYNVHPSNATDQTLTFTSDNPEVAEVYDSGLVLAVGGGTTTIRAEAASGIMATCEVTVTASHKPVSEVVLSMESAVMKAGETLTINAVVLPDDASNKNVLWKSSNAKVATVDEAGNVTALSEGFTAIAAMSETDNQIAFCNIVVENKSIRVKSIAVTPASITMEVGEETTLETIILPKDASNQTIHWSSDNNSVASVDSSGKVTGAASGSAIISVVTEDGGHHAKCQVTVTNNTSSRNLALDAKAVSNSVSSSGYAANKAIDGNNETRWLAKSNVDDVYLELDFNKRITFNKIKLKEFGNRISQYALQYYDGAKWVDFYTGTNIGEHCTIDFNAVTAEKIRILVLAKNTSYGSSIYEFEVYNIIK